MPHFTNFLKSNHSSLPTFLTAAHREMVNTTLDRYVNAFELLKIDDVIENLNPIAKEYIKLFQQAKIEDETELSSQSLARINYFVDKLLTIACYEILDGKGELREEIIESFNLSLLCKKIHEGEVSQDYREEIEEIQKKFSLTDENAIKKLVTNALVKGYASAIVMTIIRLQTTSDELTKWREADQDNKLTEGIINNIMNHGRTDPARLYRNQDHLKSLCAIIENPEIVKHTLSDNNYYKCNLNSYFINTIIGAVSSIQKMFTESTNDLKSKEAKNYRLLVSTNLSKLMDALMNTQDEVDLTLVSSLIKSIREETNLFVKSSKNKLSNFFNKTDVSKFNDVFTALKNVEILSHNFYRSKTQLDPSPSPTSSSESK